METPIRQHRKILIDTICNKFTEYFSSFGCIWEDSVLVSSGIDPTVRFIGSHISVFKKYLIDTELPTNGVMIVQDCVRTKNLKRYSDDEFYPSWGSFFTSIGALVPFNQIEEIANLTINFLYSVLEIKENDLILRVNSKDRDLYRLAEKTIRNKELIEVNAKNIEYYRHKIGLESVFGRNFNYALLNRINGEIEDIGNFIILEKNGVPHSIEIALGTSTIIKILHSFSHVLDCYPLVLQLNESVNEALRIQIEDCIITSSKLLSEGLLPSNKHNRNRILKKYILRIDEIKSTLGLNGNNLLNSIFDYEIEERRINTPLFEYLKTNHK
ncbi:hypothetical protein [uncultured Draconibacterium sp.]|uniref:hypothetical protein n=1 Tax=uncultured Draconibacterium sp. TaxID=1573823 RepID=UPI003217B0CC